MKYIDRIADQQIKRYLDTFGAVLLEGPKWCGKTWAARHVAQSEYDVADPTANFRNREIALLTPKIVLDGKRPRLIDEWQEVPALWDAVRYEVDKSGDKGQYLLTGSSTPDDERVIHSGTGRFGRVRLETMSMAELGFAKNPISLRILFENATDFSPGLVGAFTIESLAAFLSKGGWPGLIDLPLENAMTAVNGYIDNITEIDISRIDGIKRDPDKVRALLRSLSRNVASTVKYATIAKDISEFSSVSIAPETVREYFGLLKRLFLVYDLPAWEPALKSTVRLRQTPKRILADVSLAISALGANAASLERDTKLLGSLFENQVLHDLIIYSAQSDASVKHYQDNAGLEVDAIIERRDGSWGGIEIKLGYHSEDEAAATLLKLKRKLAASKQTDPSFLAVITGIGSISKRRDDGVFVIPIDHLGP